VLAVTEFLVNQLFFLLCVALPMANSFYRLSAKMHQELRRPLCYWIIFGALEILRGVGILPRNMEVIMLVLLQMPINRVLD
jgi:hypothetical protein